MSRFPHPLYHSRNFKEVEWIDFVKGTDKQPMRAGMIPYFIDNANIYLICARREDNNKLTDFGGGCKVKLQETAKVCLLRETQEEGDNFIYDLIKDSLDNESSTQIIYDNEFIAKIRIFQKNVDRQGLYEQYNLFIPVMLNYNDYLMKRQSFIPNAEVASIELVELYKLKTMPIANLTKIFDGSPLAFIKLLHSFPLDQINISIQD